MIIDSSQIFMGSSGYYSQGTSVTVKTTETFEQKMTNISDVTISKSVGENNVMEDDTKLVFRTLLDLLMKIQKEHEGYWGTKDGLRGFSGMMSYTNSEIPTIWTKTTELTFSYCESQGATYEANGKAVCKDGREIDFNLNLAMSREFSKAIGFAEYEQVETIFTDPLVINLDSNPVSVSDKTFLFDLDCDGEKENISKLASNSGFLAYDKNNDGIINDGSELFGTLSGNGFYDLSKYDSDYNGFIDEADDIYGKLKVWVCENGENKLISLKGADVGAIYLGYSDTDFSLNNENNDSLAAIRTTGIYLRESGGCGTLQNIDFAVSK